jgi:hypothetical protein
VTIGGRTVMDPVPTGGRASGGYTVVDMAPTGGRAIGGTTATGGRLVGGTGGVDTIPSGGRAAGGTTATGGRMVGGTGGIDTIPSSGRAAGGTAAIGGGTLNATGGRASGGYTVVDMAPTGGRAMGGYSVVDMAPTGGRGVLDPVPTGGRGLGGVNGDGGVAAIAGRIASADSTSGTRLAGFVGDPAIGGDRRSFGVDLVTKTAAVANTTIVDPPPPPRPPSSATGDQTMCAASLSPTEHWRDTRPTRLTKSRDLPLWDPPEVTLRGRIEAGKVAVALCTSDAFISTRWKGKGLVESGPSGAVWQPTARDDQIAVCVRSEGGLAFATLRAADIEGYDEG